MDRNAALSRLGIADDQDATRVTQAYGQRLSTVQEKLVTAQTDDERARSQTELSQLVEAYEYLTSTGRYTRARADDGAATVMRTGTELSATSLTGGTGTIVRMEAGAVLANRLEIGALLGQGGMGNVYAARDRLKDEDVAIKVLRQDLLFSTAAKDRFLAEAKVSCSLSHPNIVRVHDVGLAGDYYYFSMERLKGHTLRQRMEAYERESREFQVDEVTDIARQLIDALRYAHRYIVHRDIKPENIWLAEDGTVKLMDFGIARAYSNSQLTQTGMTLGTAYYMAPEQRAAAKEVDWKADQYALGVVLYEMFAGTLPTGAVKPLETVRRDMPRRYARALMRAMAPKPADRFASLNDLLAEIEAPDRKMPVGVGALLLISGGLAAAAVAAFVVINGNPFAKAPEATAATPPAAQAPASTPAEASAPAGTTATDTPASSGRSAAPASTTADTGSGDSTPSPAAATALVADQDATSNPAGSVESPVDAMPAPAVSKPRPAPVDTMAARREECVRQCDRDDGECRSLSRRGKQDCMRAIAFGANRTSNYSASANCAFYGGDRCDAAIDHDACIARMSDRYQACVGLTGGSVAAGRQDCENMAREADKLCLTEIKDCRASCQ